nr:reverse transcriptase domain-containing protein [Tanacetum cinerariifolium]
MTLTKVNEQMTSLTSLCELACQIVQKNLEEKQLEEEQAAKGQSWKFPVCYDEEGYNSLNDDIISKLPPYSAVTPAEPIDSLSMGDEHLNTILKMESDEFIKSCVENLVPNPSESEGESGCEVLACFTTFSNVLFDEDYDSDSSDDQSLSVEYVREKIYSNPLFDKEIIPMEIDQHSFNAESDLIGSMPNHDSSITISSKIDSLFDEFAGELTLLKSFPPGIDKTDCHPEKEIRLTKRLLYDNSSPRPSKEIVSDNSNTDIESFSPSPIPNEDSDPLMEEIDLFLNPDDPMPPGIEDDDDDSERDPRWENDPGKLGDAPDSVRDTMADQRTMTELLRAPTEGYAEAIVVPSILAEQFKLKHSLINMMTTDQFLELEKDNPHDHICWFNKITSTIKYKDVPNSAIKLMLLPFSRAGAAYRWLEKEPLRSIHTWEDLVSKFINEFFPPQEQ